MARRHWPYHPSVDDGAPDLAADAPRAVSASPPADLPKVLKLLSRGTHWLFYVILLLLPILGWIAASAYRVTPYLVGIIPLPALVMPNERFGGQVGELHGILAWAMLAIIALLTAGVMYHALIKKDGVLSRMLPNKRLWPSE